MKVFLRLKHWQILLFFFVPIIFAPMNPYAHNLASAVSGFIWIGWIYSVGLSCFNQLRPEDFSAKYFKVCFYIICLINLISISLSLYLFNSPLNRGGEFDFLIAPVLIIGFPSIFYMFYFSARMLKSLLAGRLVEYSQYTDYFFGFFYFPIGIWFIQPRVNELFKATQIK